MVQASRAAHLVLEHFHHLQSIEEAGERVGNRQPFQLRATVAQPGDHVVEDLGQVADLAARGHRQVDIEVALCDFRGRLGEAVERPHDQQTQQIGERADHGEQQEHDAQGDVAQACDLAERLGRRDLRHGDPVQRRDDAHTAHHTVAGETGELDGAALAGEQAVRGVARVALAHQFAGAALGADDDPAGAGHQVDLPRLTGGEASQRVGDGAQVHARRQGADETAAAATATSSPPSRFDRHGNEYFGVRAGGIPVWRAQRPVVVGQLRGPVGGERHRPGLRRARRHDVTVMIEDHELAVVGEPVAHRVEVIGQPLEVDARVHGLAVRDRDPLEVFSDLIGAREDAQIVAELLGPEVDFAQCLRAHAEQLLGGFGLQRALVFDVGDPHRRERRQQRREDGEHQHLGADAREPRKSQKSQAGIPPLGCHKIHPAHVTARPDIGTVLGITSSGALEVTESD